MRELEGRFDRPGFPFLVGGAARGQLFAAATALRGRLAGHAPVVVLAQDRETYAIAVLATLAGAPPLVLPHAPTAAVLRDVHRVLPFQHVLGDAQAEAPPGVDLVRPSIPEGGAADLRVTRPAGDPFVHLFTGGSTRGPRVWQKTVGNLLWEARYLAESLGVSSEDVVLATVPAFHIYGLLMTVLVPLVTGCRVVAGTTFFPREIEGTLAASGATVLVSVPAHYRHLARRPLAQHQLRLAVSSGAPLAESDAAAFHARTGVGVTEVFGSTETGGIATRCRAAGEQDWSAFRGVDWRVVAGQLEVRSPFLSPSLERIDGGFYRTADRAAATAPGRFEVLGRADGVVKVGGKRVDIAEVEEVLRGLASVSDAAVYARDAAGGRNVEIFALAVASASAAELRSALRERLPGHAVPRRLAVVGAIPLSAVGKRTRAAAEELLDAGAADRSG